MITQNIYNPNAKTKTDIHNVTTDEGKVQIGDQMVDVNVLVAIQSELRAPKNQYNSFGKFRYRSAEGILESLKPILRKYGAELTLSDEIVAIGGRIYVKATATLECGGKTYVVHGYAREDEQKKGMDGCQITGTASSYARKYALNGLLLIDDSKDADTDEYQATVRGTETPVPATTRGTATPAPAVRTTPAPAPVQTPTQPVQTPEIDTAAAVKYIAAMCAAKGISIDKICDRYHVNDLTELNKSELLRALAGLRKSPAKSDAEDTEEAEAS